MLSHTVHAHKQVPSLNLTDAVINKMLTDLKLLSVSWGIQTKKLMTSTNVG